MTENQQDLWPSDLGIPSIVTPAAILKTQAALLGERTKGVLEGTVQTSTSGGNIYHQFVIVVPALGNYRYALIRIHHPVTLYPVFVDEEPTLPRSPLMPDLNEDPTPHRGPFMPDLSFLGRDALDNEEAFRNWLRATLASDATKQIVANLYALASGQ